MNRSTTNRHLIPVAFIVTIATWRVVTYFFDHNGFLGLTPICAIALFGAAYFRGPILPFIVPIAALFLSDLVLCFTVYAPFRQGLLYEGWHWVYLSFMLIILAGKQIMKKLTVKNILTAMLVSSVIHWLIATLSECVQVQSSQSFVQLYLDRLAPAAAYELRILAGTVIYGSLLFGGYHLLTATKLTETKPAIKKG